MRRSPVREVRFIIALLATAAMTCLGIIAGSDKPSRAYADTIATKKAEAQRVQAEIQQIDTRMDVIVQQYDRANAHLRRVRSSIRENKELLRVAEANRQSVRAELGRILVSHYKSGEPDPITYILASESMSDLTNNLEAARRVSQSEAGTLEQLVKAEKQIVAKRHTLQAEGRRAERLVSEARTQKRQVLAQLDERSRLLDSLNAGIRQLIAQQRQRAADQAAARAAQAAAAAAAAASQQTQSSGSNNPPPPGSAPAPSSLGAQAAALAQQYLGVPYVWGGASPSGFDCSGLTMYVYAQLGVSLSHYTGDQWNQGVHVSRSELAPGDLVFFSNLSHEGMYIGNGLFIHAPHTGDVVKISSLSESYYASNYYGAVRVTG